jgi:predicted AAA+ superfamily ATPase
VSDNGGVDSARTRFQAQVRRALTRSRAVVLAGPRQSGKSTLAASLEPRRGARWFDLENPLDRQRLEQPMTALAALQESAGVDAGPIAIDEVPLAPGLFPVLRVLIDPPAASTSCSAARTCVAAPGRGVAVRPGRGHRSRRIRH